MQRVRISVPFFERFGWEPLILRTNPDEQEGVKDFVLEKTISKNTKIWQSGFLPKIYTRWLGIKSIGLRSFFHLAFLGNKIIETNSPDLIFISTTMFPLMLLGHYWKKRYGIPYVLDFQDPWLSDYYKQSHSRVPPGGSIKYQLSQSLATLLEPMAVKDANHIISVSPVYSRVLQHRYPSLTAENFSVLPFGAPEKDFELLSSLQISQNMFDPDDGNRHWVYVGRGGDDMAFALKVLFHGLQTLLLEEAERRQNIRLHFIGTSYSSSHTVKTVEPIAQEYGLTDLVQEYTERIPYFEALKVLRDSDAILLVGSDDPGYTASKLFPCILAHKPICAIFHEASSVVSILKQCQSGVAVTFNPKDTPSSALFPMKAALNWLLSLPKGYCPNTNWSAFKEYTAYEMARKQCGIFESCLKKRYE